MFHRSKQIMFETNCAQIAHVINVLSLSLRTRYYCFAIEEIQHLPSISYTRQARAQAADAFCASVAPKESQGQIA